MSTKIHALVDALGNPLAFLLTPGQAHDLDGADVLLPQMQADILLADKAFDADKRVIEPLLSAGKTPVIPPMPGRKSPRPSDRALFAARHLIENFFCKLKQFRAIATRYDKRAINFLAGVLDLAGGGDELLELRNPGAHRQRARREHVRDGGELLLADVGEG